MKYKGTLIVVKDCNRALKFYRDMFGLQLLQDNDGNTISSYYQNWVQHDMANGLI